MKLKHSRLNKVLRHNKKKGRVRRHQVGDTVYVRRHLGDTVYVRRHQNVIYLVMPNTTLVTKFNMYFSICNYILYKIYVH